MIASLPTCAFLGPRSVRLSGTKPATREDTNLAPSVLSRYRKAMSSVPPAFDPASSSISTPSLDSDDESSESYVKLGSSALLEGSTEDGPEPLMPTYFSRAPSKDAWWTVSVGSLPVCVCVYVRVFCGCVPMCAWRNAKPLYIEYMFGTLTCYWGG